MTTSGNRISSVTARKLRSTTSLIVPMVLTGRSPNTATSCRSRLTTTRFPPTTNLDDACHAVRLSNRRQSETDPLVGHFYLRSECPRRAGANGGSALRRTDAVRGAHERDLGGASQ